MTLVVLLIGLPGAWLVLCGICYPLGRLAGYPECQGWRSSVAALVCLLVGFLLVLLASWLSGEDPGFKLQPGQAVNFPLPPIPDGADVEFRLQLRCGACGRDHEWAGRPGPVLIECPCGEPLKLDLSLETQEAPRP